MRDWGGSDGSIDRAEWRKEVRALGGGHMVADNQELDAIFESIDKDGGGTLDIPEVKKAPKRLHTSFNLYFTGIRVLDLYPSTFACPSTGEASTQEICGRVGATESSSQAGAPTVVRAGPHRQGGPGPHHRTLTLCPNHLPLRLGPNHLTPTLSPNHLTPTPSPNHLTLTLSPT